MANPFTQQLDALVKEVAELRSRSQHEDCSDVMNETRAFEIATRGYAAIERASGKNSPYTRRAGEILQDKVYEQLKAVRLVAVVQSLSADIAAGYLQSLEELIHGDVFADFLEMADHLVASGYKDAGAVVAGSSLEAHLRQMAKKAGVATETITTRGTEPKKADLLNAHLGKAGAYSGLDQKSVTAWLGLRNKAAHGQYSEYQKEQVTLMIEGIRNFMGRYPA